MLKKNNLREIRGLAILAMGSQIRRVDASTYRVKSQSGNSWYLVQRNDLEWSCECPDFRYRHVVCKHIYAVMFSQTLRQRVMSENLGLEEIDEPDVVCKRGLLLRSLSRVSKTGKSQKLLEPYFEYIRRSQTETSNNMWNQAGNKLETTSRI